MTAEEVKKITIGEMSPRPVAEITLCGAIKLKICESADFIKPTKEQIKNLKDMLCIDVKLMDDDSDN